MKLSGRSSNRHGRRRGLLSSAAPRSIAALVATLLLAVGLTVPTAAQAAGTGVLTIAITPVDDAGNPLAVAQRGANANHVGYRVDYSCAVADCTNATVKLSAPQTNPWGIAVSGVVAPSMLRYLTWTPPAAGAAAPPSGDDVTGKTFSLGTLAAGSSGSFTAVYGFADLQRAPAAASMYPDGFQLSESATISSPTATAAATATSAPVTWKTVVPAPSIAISDPGVVKPDTNVAYKIYMTDGSVYWSSGNFYGNSGAQTAGNTTVTVQVPPQAVVVNSGGGVFDAATNTITWAEGTVANPTQCAGGGWGLPYDPQGSWNTVAPCQAPRTIVLSYPAANFPAADANGCNFSTNVTPTAAVSATYLDTARTTKSATASRTTAVSCYNPFGRINAAKDISNGTASGANQKNVAVPPDVTGLTCPASGFDDWGTACTAGQPIPAYSPVSRYWAVYGYNAGNVPGVVTITDTQLDQPGMPVTRITASATTPVATIAYTYQCGTSAPVSGTIVKTDLYLNTLTTGTDCRFTSATVTSGSVAPGNIRPSDGNVGTLFQVNFSFLLAPGTATGVRTNTANASISYPGQPQLGTLTSNPVTMNANLTPWPKAAVKPSITASFPAAPVVAGGGQAVPGSQVTYTVGGGTGQFGGSSDFAPQYVFFAPVGWTVKPGSAAFASAPAGVTFTYSTVTVSGQPRSVVVAQWPSGTVFGMNGTLPSMTVVASPTGSVAAGTSSVAAFWLGDSRNIIWTNTTANFANAVQDTPDADGDGSTAEYFSSASSAALTVGAASGAVVTKLICSPNPAQADGCDWIGNPGQSVQVSTVATSVKYRITVQNTGNTALTNVMAYDVLPYVGDAGTSDATVGTPRGSTFDEKLVSATTAASGVTLSYSTSTNPPRPEVYSGATTGTWTAPVAGASALRISRPGSLAAGQSFTVDYTAAVGTGASADARACNSVALRTSQTLTSEPPAVCAVTSEADLAVSGPATVTGQVGRPVAVPFTVVNNGGSAGAVGTATVTVPQGLRVTDLAPAGWTCTGPTGAPVTGPATLTCTPAAPLARGVSVPLTLSGVVTQPDVTVGTSMTGPAYDPDTANNQSGIRIVSGVAATGGLTVGKTDGVVSATVGQQLTYTVTVTNQLTTESVSGVSVTDALPAGTQFVSASGGGTLTGGTVTWTVPALAAAATVSRTVVVEVLPGAGTTITNQANASAPDPGFAGATLTGSATDTDTVDRLTLTKTGVLANPSSPKPGDTVTYTFVLTNAGGGPLSAVAIADPMPGLSAITIASWPSLPNRLAAGERVTGTATYTLTQADLNAGTVNNTATATAQTVENRAVQATASSAIPLAAAPAMTLAKTASRSSTAPPLPGDIVTFSFVVRNTGNVSLNAVAIADALPGLSALSYGAWPGTPGSLDAGAAVTATATYTLTAADIDSGHVDNTATASGTAPGGVGVTANGAVRLDLPATAGLRLDKTGVQAHPAQATAGDTVTYTFVITNTGNVTLTGVTTADPLPGLSALSYGAWPGASGVLAAGQSVTATATYTTTQADADAGRVDNTATVTGRAPDGSQTSAVDATTVAIPADPALALQKTAVGPSGLPKAGDTVTYTFVVRNAGSLTVTGVQLTDPLPGLSTPVFGAWPGAAGTLAPNAQVTATATYQLTQADIDRGHIDNVATATGTAAGGRPLSTTDGNTVVLAAAPTVTLSKTASAPASTPHSGDTVAYTFVVKNTGNVTVGQVALSDALPGVSAPAFGSWPGTAGELAPGQEVTATARYALTQADLDAGTVVNTATATATGVRGGAARADDSATTTLAAAPAIALTKSADPANPTSIAAGDTIRYTFVVRNTGNVTVSGIAVADALPGLSAIAYGVWPDVAGTLAPGQQVEATADYTLTQDDLDLGDVYNEATASGVATRGGPVRSTSDVTVALPAAGALTFTKTGALEDAARPVAGQLATFTFTIVNSGNQTVTGVDIVDTLPGLSAIVYDAWPASPGFLAPGQRVVAHADHVLTQADVDAGTLRNTATVTGTPARGDDLEEAASVAVPIAAVPGLALVKRAELHDANLDGTANAGERITYSFEVRNTGNVTLHDDVVNDPKVSGIPRIASLAPGASTVVQAADYVVTDADIRAGAVRNTATASGIAPDGSTVDSASSSTSVVADPPTSVAGLAKTGLTVGWLAIPVALIAILMGTALLLLRRRRLQR